ncbi:DNA polymerase III subunit alpha [Alicyclobacillus shizuokensis]|uniref:DNA polymerase III subunit alpha n=1 Tax=Alicyclobacillus shizuokensis TaxID=392014 RepID=UPI00083686AC|nr:DNA polymerase III subunit alpha [Alicyclobacillus shizuokensis]MCL6626474.1 DNA polymerase III subunit alpha [Alicyclobacillus shizuokensis]
MDGFVHLHVHSEYSLLQSPLRLTQLVQRAAELGMPAVALTDTHALYGAVSFYTLARQAGVRPILGAQLTVVRDAGVWEQPGRPAPDDLDTAVLLAENLQGYAHLVELVTLTHTRPRLLAVTLDEVAARAGGLIALVGGGESAVLRRFAAGDEAGAAAWLDAWQAAMPTDSLFLDLQDHGVPEERRGLPGLLRAARARGLQPVATNDVHYLEPSDAPVQRLVAAIDAGAGSPRLQSDTYAFVSGQEMARRFAQIPQALANTLAIAERCQLELPLGQLRLPKYPLPAGESAARVLRQAAEAGAVQRYGQVGPDVQERLQYELQVIEQLGFADYFLVVADFIRFAHRQGISTGPGRGSAAGSLVAYCLRITDVDPIANQLLFERFLNPERVSWPDIDTDFEYERRGEVIRYVVERYGADHVAQIGTFGTLAARAAVRDAGRALGVEPRLVDQLARHIPSGPGMTLQRAAKEAPEITRLTAEKPELRPLWQAAQAIEGLPRHTSIHAAGVVISPDPLSTLVPTQPGPDGVAVTQFAMEDVERMGLIKMDFLGLRTLTLIDACVESVRRRTGKSIPIRALPDGDEATFAMLGRGETNGCFQLESAGVRRILRQMRPHRLEDLIAVISLYRPGPMENIPTFLSAREGETPIRYPHPDLEPILRDTYGVIVYQEQIMQIAARMAGFSLGQADLLRRAVSKKKRDVLDAERARFVEGCVRRGYAEQTAHEVYDLIVRFADYGFNRSHAAAYAVLCYRTAYLRAHYPADFFAALLSLDAGHPTKHQEYLRDARRLGIEILPPSIQDSGPLYTVAGERQIRTGLLSIRNVGRGAVEAILEARRERPFSSLVDVLTRVHPRRCNRKAMESLLAAGALDVFLPDGAAPAAKRQILDEAYQEAGEGAQTRGLGLTFTSGPAADAAASLGAARAGGDAAGAGGRDPSGEEALFVRYHPDRLAADGLLAVQEVLHSYPGSLPVALYDEKRRRARLLPGTWSVALSPDLIGALEEIVGLGNARVGRLPRAKRPASP